MKRTGVAAAISKREKGWKKMKTINKILSLALCAALAVGTLAGCGASSSSAVSSAVSAATSAAQSAAAGKDVSKMKIGVIQLTEHEALDAACKGFIDGMVAAGFSADNIEVQNAQGEQPNCVTIANTFVNNKVDLILAIATPAAQAAAQATKNIPILVTAVTDPASAGLVASNDAPGGNVSGTSDMNPIDEQVALLRQLAPNAKTVGILYCSSEDNSKLQADLAQAALEKEGLTVQVFTAADTNEVQAVTQTACGKVDAIYIPTDNLFASAMDTVSMVTINAKIPVICGESNMVNKGGLATYGIDYYALGQMTAKQAVQVLVDGVDVGTIPIGYSSAEDLAVTVNEDTAAAIGITIPAELKK